MGATYWRLRTNDTGGDQDHRPGLLLQQAGIKSSVLDDDHNGGGRCTGGSVHVRPEITTELELRVDALPR